MRAEIIGRAAAAAGTVAGNTANTVHSKLECTVFAVLEFLINILAVNEEILNRRLRLYFPFLP